MIQQCFVKLTLQGNLRGYTGNIQGALWFNVALFAWLIIRTVTTLLERIGFKRNIQMHGRFDACASNDLSSALYGD